MLWGICVGDFWWWSWVERFHWSYFLPPKKKNPFENCSLLWIVTITIDFLFYFVKTPFTSIFSSYSAGGIKTWTHKTKTIWMAPYHWMRCGWTIPGPLEPKTRNISLFFINLINISLLAFTSDHPMITVCHANNNIDWFARLSC